MHALADQFEPAHFRRYCYPQKAGAPNFPVLLHDGQISSSLALSSVLQNLPLVSVDTIYAAPHIRAASAKWLNKHRSELLRPDSEEDSQ